MSSVQEIRRWLVEVSRRHSRVEHEAEDVAHDIILAALRRGVPLDGESFIRSARRAARLHAAFLARSAGRRRAREACALAEPCESVCDAIQGSGLDGSVLPKLSPALRTTLFLLVLGLEKAELRSALGVNDATLRKRFQALRRQGPWTPVQRSFPREASSFAVLRRSQIRLLPPLAGRLVQDQRAQRVLAASDPDGHGLIFTELLTNGRVTATTGARPDNPEPRKKGKPCSTASSRTSRSSSS